MPIILSFVGGAMTLECMKHMSKVYDFSTVQDCCMLSTNNIEQGKSCDCGLFIENSFTFNTMERKK